MSDAGAQVRFVPPSAEEALARLDMPLEDAMRTQRAVRRLHLEPVSHDVLLPLLELALKAPTSSNSQDWCFVVVEDRAVKAELACLNAERKALKQLHAYASKVGRSEPAGAA